MTDHEKRISWLDQSTLVRNDIRVLVGLVLLGNFFLDLNINPFHFQGILLIAFIYIALRSFIVAFNTQHNKRNKNDRSFYG